MEFSTTKKRVMARLEALRTARQPFDRRYQALADALLPWLGRTFNPNTVRLTYSTDAKWLDIIDDAATKAARTLVAGLMSTATNPTIEWFMLGLDDPVAGTSPTNRRWLDVAAKRVHRVFSESNTYQVLPMHYLEAVVFGTAATIVEHDPEKVVHLHPLTAGEYWIHESSKREVDTLARSFQLTVAQMVEKFGRERCSEHVQRLHAEKKLDEWVDVVQLIEPREAYNPGGKSQRDMPFRSIYFEPRDLNDDKLLAEGGYPQFPALVTRWYRAPGTPYGFSPGMEALGSVLQLQHMHLRLAQGVDYLTVPPLQIPPNMRGRELRMLPGAGTEVDGLTNSAGIRPMFETRIDVSHMKEAILDVRQRIRESFHADLFRFFTSNDQGSRPGVTAYERRLQFQEQMSHLGPVAHQIESELQDPLVRFVYERIVALGELDAPPQDIQGRTLQVQYLGVLAQAQQAQGLFANDQFFGHVGVLANLDQRVLDRVDFDAAIEVFAAKVQADPRLIRPTDEVIELRRAREAAYAQKDALADVGEATKAAKDAGKAGPAGLAMLNQMVGA